MSISPEELDPAKEIRFTGGNFRSMKHRRQSWFSGKSESRLELNTVQGIVPFLDGTDYWAVCTPSMADSIGRNVSLQIYQLQDCDDTWELFFLKKESEGEKQTAAAAAFEFQLASRKSSQAMVPSERHHFQDLPVTPEASALPGWPSLRAS